MKRLASVLLIISMMILTAGCSLLEPAYVSLEKEQNNKSESSMPDSETESQKETTSEVETQKPDPVDNDLVLVKDYIPDIQLDIRYATTNNFTGKVIYESKETYLRYGTIKKLKQVQEELKKEGLSIKIWDAYRPTAAQFKLWEVCPDSRYVSDPINGFSNHSRGNTVDITVADVDGKELVMPTGFDNFTEKADRDYTDCTEEEMANALKLENLMIEYGFRPYSGEWWHFTDLDSYEVYDIETGAIEAPTTN